MISRTQLVLAARLIRYGFSVRYGFSGRPTFISTTLVIMISRNQLVLAALLLSGASFREKFSTNLRHLVPRSHAPGVAEAHLLCCWN